jgi:transposase
VARVAQALWPLAHHLYPHESLVQEWRAGPSFRTVAAGADRPHPDRVGQTGLHHRQGAPGRHRRLKKNGPQAIGKSRGGWTTKIHLVAANARTAITFALSPGQASDAVEGRKLLGGIGPLPAPLHLILDGAYDDHHTLQLVLDFGYIPVVPPRPNRLDPWQYDQALYGKRNEVERLFRRLKGFRRIFSRFDKLDVVFLGFLNFALIVEALRFLNSVNMP